MENIFKELKELGATEEEIKEILLLAEEEVMEYVLEDFAMNAEEKLVDEYTERFVDAKENPEQLKILIQEAMNITYGAENVESKKNELITEYLQNFLDLTKKTKEVGEKYSQGDPETIQAVEEAKKSPVVQQLTKEVEEDQDNG
jgi:hypothetical protein